MVIVEGSINVPFVGNLMDRRFTLRIILRAFTSLGQLSTAVNIVTSASQGGTNFIFMSTKCTRD